VMVPLYPGSSIVQFMPSNLVRRTVVVLLFAQSLVP